MITINEISSSAKEFAWDGCHKLYLMNTEKDRQEFLEHGYTLFPIEKLKECYDSSCSLKFISDGDLRYTIARQSEEATIGELV